MRIAFRTAMLGSAALLASACGGGGGGGGGDGGGEEPPPVEGIPPAPSTPVALSTKTHVLREVGNTIEVYAAFFNLDLEGATNVSPRAVLVPAKAAGGEPCELGGTREIVEGSGTRAFDFFDVSDTVTFVTEVNDGCDESTGEGDGTHTTYDGYFEQGDTPLGPDDDSYAYEEYGRDGGRYAQVVRNPAAPNDSDFRDAIGEAEYFLSPTRTELRSVRELRYEKRAGTQYGAGTVVRGMDGDPFVTRFDAATGGLEFDGTYRYATTLCAGGQASVTTVAPVTLDDTSYPNGGQLRFSNGTSSVNVTFNLDGSASFQFDGGGGNGTLTRADIVGSPGRC